LAKRVVKSRSWFALGALGKPSTFAPGGPAEAEAPVSSERDRDRVRRLREPADVGRSWIRPHRAGSAATSARARLVADGGARARAGYGAASGAGGDAGDALRRGPLPRGSEQRRARWDA